MTDERQAEPAFDAPATAPSVPAESEVVASSPRPSVSPPSSSSDGGDAATRIATAARSATRDTARRARAKLTLRIPDDEVARPTPSAPPVAALSDPPTSYASRPPSMPAPPPPQATPAESPPAPAVAVQPTRIIQVGAGDSVEPPARSSSEPPPAARADAPHAARDQMATPAPDSGEPLDLDEAETQAVLSSRPPPAAPTTVSVPAPPKVPSVPAAPPTEEDLAPAAARARAATEPDGEDVSFDDDDPPPPPPSDLGRPERISEVGDAPEIAAEDMVSIESVPAPRAPTSGLTKAAPPVSGQTAALQPPPPMRAKVPSMPNGGAQARPALPLPQRGQLVIVPPHVGVTQPTPDPASRRKGRAWWEELFNDDFIRTMAKISQPQIAGEVDFIEDSLGVEKGGALLDLGCGTGRHAIELARRGYEIVGFDLSLAMLARATDEAQERAQKLNFVQGDMREMTFDESFDGVYSWNTSFGYFDEETNGKVIAKVRTALKTGGQFLLDVINRDYIIRQAPSLAWFEGDGCVCMDEMSIDWITSRMKVKRTMMMDDGRAKETEYSVRVYSLHELGKILHEQGFRVVEVSGRTATPGVFFGNESPRVLILAEKR